MLRRFYLTILRVGAVLAGDWFLMGRLHSGFLPDEDKGVLMCEVELPQV